MCLNKTPNPIFVSFQELIFYQKLSDPDVIFEGDEYQESLESTSSDDCTDIDSEISETQSGEELS